MADRCEPDIAGELAAVEAQYQAKLERAEAEYQLDLKTADLFASGRLSTGEVFYVPLGPKQAARKRDDAVREAEAEYDLAVERIERKDRVRRLAVEPEADEPANVELSQKAKKPRHRPPGGIPIAAVRKLEVLLAERRRTGRPTQEEIAAEVERVAKEDAPRLRFDRNRVQQAEELLNLGWPLLRSQREFSADDGFVYWPTTAKAARILASERSD